MAKVQVFHVGQFDAFWSMTPEQAVAFLEAGIRGDAYDLDEAGYKRIKKPRHITKDRDTGGYDAGYRQNYFNMPCDWDVEEWKYHREIVRDEYGI